MVALSLTFAVLGALALLKGLISLLEGWRFKHRMARALGAAHPPYAPRVTVLVPCKGLDSGFLENIASIMNQAYADFHVVFVLDSHDDPAHDRLQQLVRLHRTPAKIVTAGRTRARSQKLHNLLRALHEVDQTTEVLVFADSDIRAPNDWLTHLVRPLADPHVGVSTGYRWYMPVEGDFWSAVCSVWNMTTANVLFDQRFAFAWGGSMAIRKQTFEALDIAGAWEHGLSDDMILTQAVKRAGYRVEFVPRSLVVSTEAITWPALIAWMSRQLTIVRVYDPQLWNMAAWPHWAFTAIFFLGFFLVLKGLFFNDPIPWPAWLMISDLALGGLINRLRFSAFKMAMPEFRARMQRFWWAYVSLHVPAAWIMSWSLLKSAVSNRIVWRGIAYELRSPEETVVLQGREATGPGEIVCSE